jgi:hypothetical protein
LPGQGREGRGCGEGRRGRVGLPGVRGGVGRAGARTPAALCAFCVRVCVCARVHVCPARTLAQVLEHSQARVHHCGGGRGGEGRDKGGSGPSVGRVASPTPRPARQTARCPLPAPGVSLLAMRPPRPPAPRQRLSAPAPAAHHNAHHNYYNYYNDYTHPRWCRTGSPGAAPTATRRATGGAGTAPARAVKGGGEGGRRGKRRLDDGRRCAGVFVRC